MIGWAIIGCSLEWASLPNWESGGLLVMITDGFWQWLQRGSVSFGVILILGSASVALVPGLTPVALGQDSTAPLLTLPHTPTFKF